MEEECTFVCVLCWETVPLSEKHGSGKVCWDCAASQDEEES